jgi:hypothetical protein
MLLPDTVTLTEPVPAVLPRDRSPDSAGALYDTTSVMLPTRTPAVMLAATLPTAPAPVLQYRAESDAHSLDSQPCGPVRADGV